MRIYIDRKLACEKVVADQPIRRNPGQDIYIGRNGAWFWHYLDGKIDKLRFAAEATDRGGDFGSDVTAPALQTLAHYRFETIDDRSQILNVIAPNKHVLQVLNAETPLTDGGDAGLGRVLDMTLNRPGW